MEELCVPFRQTLQCKHNGLAVSENFQDRLTDTDHVTFIYGQTYPYLPAGKAHKRRNIYFDFLKILFEWCRRQILLIDQPTPRLRVWTFKQGE